MHTSKAPSTYLPFPLLSSFADVLGIATTLYFIRCHETSSYGFNLLAAPAVLLSSRSAAQQHHISLTRIEPGGLQPVKVGDHDQGCP